MSAPSPLSTSRLHYAWIVAAVTFATLLVAAGARAAPGVMLLPFGNEFQWSRATVSSIVSINIFLYGLIGPFAAALYQRFGLRRSMTVALGLISAGYGLSMGATQYWQFVVLWGGVVGAGSGMAATVLGAAVANRWFTSRRGLVMGVLTASTATGQLVFLPSLATAVSERGWRAAPLIVALATAAVMPVIWLLMRDDPRDVGRRPYGEEGAPDAMKMGAGIQPGNPAARAVAVLVEAVKVRDFWLLAGSFFVCGASTNGLIGTHLIPAAFDCGIPEVRTAGLLALMGLFDLVGTTASGWLSDRYNCRYLLFGYYGLRGLSLLFLPQALVGPVAGLGLFAVFYGLDWIATVPPTVRLTAEVFGREKASIVFGWVVASHQVGAAFAAFTAGALRTTFGSYAPAFIGAGALCLLAALAVLPIARRPVAVTATV
ncbi:MFS transporter [Horticoccus sp. 23ND18S-11]|uniref:MFS transporter n=1 Tax=Horticoccus sp. 23ND18S-11 TaxID=3391832 RepID=UPI0039C8D9EA